MSKEAFLEAFFDEPIYVIKEGSSTSNKLGSLSEAPGNTTTEITSSAAERALIFTGNKSSDLAIIVNSTSNKAEMALLGKILGAIKYSLDSACVIDLSKNEDFKASSMKNIKANKIIAFDSGANLFSTPVYQPTTINERTVIVSDPLGQLTADDSKKKQLWVALKKLF